MTYHKQMGDVKISSTANRPQGNRALAWKASLAGPR